VPLYIVTSQVLVNMVMKLQISYNVDKVLIS